MKPFGVNTRCGSAIRIELAPPNQLRQLGDIHRNPPRLIFGEKLGRFLCLWRNTRSILILQFGGERRLTARSCRLAKGSIRRRVPRRQGREQHFPIARKNGPRLAGPYRVARWQRAPFRKIPLRGRCCRLDCSSPLADKARSRTRDSTWCGSASTETPSALGTLARLFSVDQGGGKQR